MNSHNNLSEMTSMLSPKELLELYPLSIKHAHFVEKSRLLATRLLEGTDPRILVMVGPCSIHDSEGALEYASKLKKLAKEVSKTCFLIMRVFIEKPRTILGWKGFLYDHTLSGEENLQEGLIQSRKLFLDLTALEIPIAMEFLEPLAAHYLKDLVTWGIIGARTSESQIHRQLASFLPMPMGFKNRTDGNLDAAIHGALSAQSAHSFFGIDEMGKITTVSTAGNPHTHIILRGSHTEHNADKNSIQTALDRQAQVNFYRRILVDCAHGNCQKNLEKQKETYLSVLDQILDGNVHIMGMMLESYLDKGQQQPFCANLSKRISITDPCLSWEETKQLILWTDSIHSALLCSKSN